MGLDMYLFGVFTKFGLGDYNIGEVKTSVEVGYWRKANQIHKWFVDNIQKGVDNCATYCVDRKDLQKLLETCQEVLRNPGRAEELLPTKDGFFFGDTAYDEWYFYDIQDTIDICKWCLDERREYDYFEYSSSW